MELNREAFEAWLRGFRPDEMVGERAMACACPIARYLDPKDTGEAQVSRLAYLSADDHNARTMPDWAAAFVAAVDDDVHVSDTVDAAECLAVLAQIP